MRSQAQRRFFDSSIDNVMLQSLLEFINIPERRLVNDA